MRDLGPCAGFADTPSGSVRMLGTSVQEVLQDCDERMKAHSYTLVIGLQDRDGPSIVKLKY